MDQIIIKDLLCQGILGILESERTQPQTIRINLVLYCDTRRAGQSDVIGDCVDYSVIANQVLAHAQHAKRFTVEALAADIAEICLENRQVVSCRVRVEKPEAVPFAAAVGVEIERQQHTC